MMKKSKRAALLATVAVLLGLSGCGESELPELTDENIQAIGEFTAVTLMKYDAHNRSRLVDMSLLEESEAEPVIPAPTPAPEGMGPTDDTPVEDITQDIYTMEEVMGLPEGMIMAYAGQEVAAKYPAEDGQDYFIVTPTSGKQLLIIRFMMSNRSEQDQEIDVLATACSFQLSVNGGSFRRALTTMLLNDLSTYEGTIRAGESQETVLVMEIDETEDVASVSFRVKNESKTHTIQLF